MSKLRGREVLVVEDHPLILFEIADALSRVGAKAITAGTLDQALTAVEHDVIAAAILDHALPDEDSSILCDKLGQRKIPFVVYSGLGRLKGPYANAILVEKQASTEELIATVENLLAA